LSLYAHVDFLAHHGHPATIAALGGHSFVSSDELNPAAPIHEWVLAPIDAQDIVFKSNDGQILNQAIRSGLGIGFMFPHEAA